MIIIGIDPAITKTGWAIIYHHKNQHKFIACGTIYTDSKQPMNIRLLNLYQEICQIITFYKPNQMAIEETFVNKNALSSLKLGHARGVLILAGAVNNIPIFEYASTSVKKTITGVGRAEKNQVMKMVKYLLPKADFKNEDEADALAIAICHCNFS